MKKNIVLIIALAVLLNISCKKNGNRQNSFQSYLKFKLDNVQTECNAHIKATYIPPSIGPDNIITISGDWAGGSISLVLNEANSVLTTGAYIFLPGKIRSGELWLPNRYYSGLQGGVFNPSMGGSGQITITEISPDYVKGYFECVLIGLSLADLRVLTNGEFYIKRG